MKIDGRKTVVKTFQGRRTEARHCDRLRRRPRDTGRPQETIIIDDLNNPIAINGFEGPIIVEEPYDYAEDGVYIKNGKEFLFGDERRYTQESLPFAGDRRITGPAYRSGYSGADIGQGHWGLPEKTVLAYLDQRANSPSLNINIIGLELLLTTPLRHNYRYRLGIQQLLLRGAYDIAWHSKRNRDISGLLHSQSGGVPTSQKLSTNYINMPLLAEFRFGCKNYAYSGKAGYVYGVCNRRRGYNIHSKIKYNTTGSPAKTKDHQ